MKKKNKRPIVPEAPKPISDRVCKDVRGGWREYPTDQRGSYLK